MRHALHQLRRLLDGLLTTALLTCVATPSFAHDIPGKATLLVYVKPETTPEGNKLLLLMRAPLEAFTEVQFPVRGPGYLDITKADGALTDAANIYLMQSLHFFADSAPLGDGQLLKVRASLPSDKSFVEFSSAYAHIGEPPQPGEEEVYWKQASLDALIAFPLPATIDMPSAKFSVDAGFQRIAMETHTVLRFVPLDGEERIFDYVGSPGLIELEPGRWHAFAQFTKLGFFHILDGIDHLLFLFCLLIPVRSIRALIPVVTAFTLAHSITLLSSALNVVPTATWFPPLIETLIALSVFYMACENIFGTRLQFRWIVVFCFGLIHGFGFSFILADRMQFAGAHLLSALLAFNVGVEFGQLFVLIVTVPLLRYAFKLFARAPRGEQIGTILLSAIAAHTAWHWLIERGDKLLQYPWERPELNSAFFAATLRWVMLAMACVGVLWLVRELIRYLNRQSFMRRFEARQSGELPDKSLAG